MMILLCSGRSQLLGDRRKAGAARADPIGEGEGIDFFIVISDLFKVGIVC